MDHLGLELAEREIFSILTPGYRPPPVYYGYGNTLPWMPFLPTLNSSIVDAMVRDYQVKLACGMRIVPIMRPKFAITGDPEVIEFVKSELRSIWTQGITQIATSLWYTRFGCEMVYKGGDDGMIRFERMMPFHPRDFRVLSKHGQIAGLKLVSTRSSANLVSTEEPNGLTPGDLVQPLYLFNPKCFAYVHGRKFGSFDGTSELEGAFQSWMEKVREGGAISGRSLWFYKCAFDSGIIMHPPGVWQDPSNDDVQVPYRDLALKVGETIRNGSVITMPSETDANGNKMWDYIRPEMNGGGELLLQLIDHLDGKINKGVGIPDDVIEQVSGTGSYAGRTIPFIAFLESSTPTVREIAGELCRQVLVPLAQLNYGNSRGKDWEITDARVNTSEFLGEESSGEKPGEAASSTATGKIAGDGDGDGVPHESRTPGANYGAGPSVSQQGVSRMSQAAQMSFADVAKDVDQLAHESGMSQEDARRLFMSALTRAYSSPTVVFEQGDPRRLGRRAKR